MNKLFLIFFLLPFLSCLPSTQFKIIKFDKTQENAAAFRECQKTFAVAVGYEQDEFNNLKIKCL